MPNDILAAAQRAAETRQQLTQEEQAYAAALRAELGRQQMQQRELATRLGKSQAWVSRRVTGEVALTASDLREIAQAFGVPASHLLADEPI